jgi:signal transduction histidine kinase
VLVTPIAEDVSPELDLILASPEAASGVAELAADETWLRLALTDPARFAELNDRRIAVRATLMSQTLARTGHSALQLALLESGLRDDLRVGDANDRVQRLWRAVAQEVAQELDLLTRVNWTSAAETELAAETRSRRQADVVCRRVLGALTASQRYERVRELVWSAVVAVDAARSPVASYKTALQEHLGATGNEITYETVGETGPPHARIFEIRVRTRERREATGRGLSKKQAGEAAARTYLAKFASRHLAALERGAAVSRRERSDRVYHRSSAFRAFADRFGVTGEGVALLSQALTHPGSGVGSDGDVHKSMAQLGASAMQVITGQLLLGELQWFDGDFRTVELALGPVSEDATSARAFDLTNLDDVFLRSTNLSLTQAIKADAYQAAVGALLTTTGKHAEEIMVPAVLAYLRDRVSFGLHAPAAEVAAPKTLLQERLAALRAEWCYSLETSGPPHDRSFRSKVAITLPVGSSFTMAGTPARSKRDAERSAALQANRLFEAGNWHLARQQVKSATEGVRNAIRNLLLSEARVVGDADKLTINRLVGLELLGSRDLLRGDAEAFVSWAEAAEELFSAEPESLADGLAPFYAAVGRVAGQAEALPYTAEIEAITGYVESLSPDAYEGDLRTSRAYAALLDFAAVLRLNSRAAERRSVPDLCDELGLLRQRRTPGVALQGAVPAVEITEPPGMLQAVLLDCIDQLGVGAETVTLQVGSSEDRLKITLSIPSSRVEPITVDREKLERSMLWRYAAAQLGHLALLTSPNEIVLTLDASRPTPKGALAKSALQAFASGRQQPAGEAAALARIVHDVKNHLVAFHIALAGDQADATARYRALLEASEHRDAARALCSALRAIGVSLAAPVIESVDAAAFFRGYVASKYATLPPNVDLAAPGRPGQVEIWTDQAYLRSILDNLIKNAVEAMPGGGRIECDWIVDDDEGKLLVEVTDTGGGMPPELMEELLGGGAVRSLKQDGSGIGMFTVRSMISRLGGSLSGESSASSGTRWIVEIPVDPPFGSRAEDQAESSGAAA